MNKELKGEIIKKFGSQFEFARVIGWHEATVSRVIRGHLVLDGATKSRWAEVLGVEAKRLFQEEIGDGR